MAAKEGWAMHVSTIDLPADEYEWDLYHRKVGSDDAARELNARLAALLEPVLDALHDSSPTWRLAQAARIRDEMHGHMHRLRHLGAADPEPRMVLNRVLRTHLHVGLER
jgi:hypothetical protein